MNRSRLLLQISGLAAVAMLSACGNGGPPTAPSPSSSAGDVIQGSTTPATPTASAPAGVPAALGTLPGLTSLAGVTSQSGAAALALLPANFPLPAGATGIYGTANAGATAVVFSLPDGQSAVSYYRAALPSAGFPLAAGSLGFPLGFTGNGITKGIVGVSGNTVGVSIYGTFTAGGPADGGASTGSGGSGGGSGGTGGKTVTIAQSSSILTVACHNATVKVRGDSDDITLTGHCHAIHVSGDSDKIVAGSADSVALSGISDEVTVHSGSPTVTKTGLNDVVNTG